MEEEKSKGEDFSIEETGKAVNMLYHRFNCLKRHAIAKFIEGQLEKIDNVDSKWHYVVNQIMQHGYKGASPYLKEEFKVAFFWKSVYLLLKRNSKNLSRFPESMHTYSEENIKVLAEVMVDYEIGWRVTSGSRRGGYDAETDVMSSLIYGDGDGHGF